MPAMRLLRGLNVFFSLPGTMDSCQIRARSLLQAQLAGRTSSKTFSKQGRLLNRLQLVVATDVQSRQHAWTFESPVVKDYVLSFRNSTNALAPFATGAASGSWDRLKKVEGLKFGASSHGVQNSGGTQHNWLKNLFGSGLAAAGIAALCASALRTDAAECETPGSGKSEDTQHDGREQRQLYPPIEPHTSGYLRVSDLHKIYWEESGNPNGQPVIFLHGGPGAGTAPNNRRFFDPDFYRIILVDQRGAGKSIPHASLVDNTTWHLVEDLEKLREILKIDKWLVFGGSWGSTLSLAYAETHPERVVGLVLRGIFMIRRHEINWFYQRGADHIFPDAWEAYRDFIPPEEHSGLVAAYHRRLMNDKDPKTQLAAARAWTAWEMATAYLRPSRESKERGEDDKFALAFARIENHYFVNGGFFPSDSWLLDNVSKIRTIPAVIIQGRYDVVCPMTSAWDLHKAWPEADFRVVPDAGHSANEVGIGAELVAATERLKRLYASGNTVESN